METHVVTLYVDTSQIDNQNVDRVSNFGQPENISNQDFTIDVSLGDVVMWQGVSSNAPETDVVLISAINHEGGVNVFDQNVLKDTSRKPGVVEGTVKKGQSGQEQKYKVSFKVLNNGAKRNGTFHIDPKIRVR
jgi:hypothetical protein